MSEKNDARLRRARQTRAKIAELGAVRLAVHRSNLHIYAQVIDPSGVKVLASASTAEAEVRQALKHGGNTKAASEVGRRIAELGIDRLLTIGDVAAVSAEAAADAGLEQSLAVDSLATVP